jgi:peptidoglycan hydrolase-like protein with peptidoglycan-binding domain
VTSIGVQPNGKILAGGAFITFNSNTRNHLVRLNADGTEDTSFYTSLGTGFDDSLFGVLAQPDGKILVGGQFTTFNGNTRNSLVRLNQDGTEDFDTTAPVITITGSNPATVKKGKVYTDQGATAEDANDGDVTSSIQSTSTVNTAVPGTYTVVYSAHDASDNYAYATRTVTVQNSSNSSGGGGGGGGGGKVKITAEIIALAKVLGTTPNLSLGTTSSSVKTLQHFLNITGYPVKKTGLGSKGKETTTFDKSTEKALKKLQLKAKLKPQTGVLDAATRQYIKVKYKATTTPSKTTTVSATKSYALALSTAPNLSLNTVSPSVKTLQQFLNAVGYAIAASGPGSKGQEIEKFGSGTQSALTRFQTANGLPATGILDAKTRSTILTRFGK